MSNNAPLDILDFGLEITNRPISKFPISPFSFPPRYATFPAANPDAHGGGRARGLIALGRLHTAFLDTGEVGPAALRLSFLSASAQLSSK